MKIKLLLGFFLVVFSDLGLAEPLSKDLNVIQQNLQQAKKSLQDKEYRKKRLEQQIKTLNQQVLAYQKEITKINNQSQQSKKELALIQLQIVQVSKEIQQTKKDIATLLNYQYRNQYPNAVILFMQLDDPNSKSRKLEYLKYIQVEQNKAFSTLKQNETNLAELNKTVKNKLNQLVVLSNKNKELLAQINAKQTAQVKLKKALEAEIIKEKQRIKSLQLSEQKLNQLLKSIDEKNKRETEKRKAALAIQNKNNRDRGSLTSEDLKLTEHNQANIVNSSESLTQSDFTKLKGKLIFPLNGKVVQSYGQGMSDGSIVRGIIIKSAPNTAVASVAAGKVVYSGEMPNYGKTVVIMHDDAYLSVYMGLSRISVANGAQVKSGTIIGRSGVTYTGEQGIYFELRENSRPINPRSWFK